METGLHFTHDFEVRANSWLPDSWMPDLMNFFRRDFKGVTHPVPFPDDW